jgi:hydrogenase maturation protease
MLNKIPTKMSPHQIGVQEVMLLSDIRGKLPKVIKLFGIIPESLEPGTSLSKTLEEKLPKLEEMILAEIKSINL